MTFIFYGVFVLIVLYLGRNYIKGWILHLKNKRNITIKEVNQDLIYVPIRSSRKFTFTLEIDEIGDGKAIISVVKTK